MNNAGGGYCDCDNCMSSRFEEKHQAIQGMTEEAIRTFETGATRNLDQDPDIHGFTSPLAVAMFANYMHRNREQADGTYRDSDNWKKGIPLDSYIRSMRRHLQDLTLHHDGFPHMAREGLEEALGGLMFNVQGYMHETVKAVIREEEIAGLEDLAEALGFDLKDDDAHDR